MVLCYILKGSDNYYYCGITNNIARRIAQHNTGMSKSTNKHRPLVIIFTGLFTNHMQARIMEKIIKNTGVQKWYNKNIKYKSSIVPNQHFHHY